MPGGRFWIKYIKIENNKIVITLVVRVTNTKRCTSVNSRRTSVEVNVENVKELIDTFLKFVDSKLKEEFGLFPTHNIRGRHNN